MIPYILTGLLSLSIFSLGAFFFAINSLYKKNIGKNINIRNSFPFESVPYIKTQNFFIDILYFLALLSMSASFFLFMSFYQGVITIIAAALSFLFVVSLAVIPFVDFSHNIKSHLYIDLALIILNFALSGFTLYLCYSICKLYDYQNIAAIISIVVAGLIFLFSICFVVNPRLFDLKMESDGNGDIKRPVTIPLALSEWLLMLTFPLEIIPLIILASVL